MSGVCLTNLLQVCDGLFQILGLLVFLLSNHLLLLLVQNTDNVGNFRVLVHVKGQVVQWRDGLIASGYGTQWDTMQFWSVRSCVSCEDTRMRILRLSVSHLERLCPDFRGQRNQGPVILSHPMKVVSEVASSWVLLRQSSISCSLLGWR